MVGWEGGGNPPLKAADGYDHFRRFLPRLGKGNRTLHSTTHPLTLKSPSQSAYATVDYARPVFCCRKTARSETLVNAWWLAVRDPIYLSSRPQFIFPGPLYPVDRLPSRLNLKNIYGSRSLIHLGLFRTNCSTPCSNSCQNTFHQDRIATKIIIDFCHVYFFFVLYYFVVSPRWKNILSFTIPLHV